MNKTINRTLAKTLVLLAVSVMISSLPAPR